MNKKKAGKYGFFAASMYGTPLGCSRDRCGRSPNFHTMRSLLRSTPRRFLGVVLPEICLESRADGSGPSQQKKWAARAHASTNAPGELHHQTYYTSGSTGRAETVSNPYLRSIAQAPSQTAGRMCGFQEVERSQRALVKREALRLLKANKHQQLLQVLGQWVGTEGRWQDVFSEKEMAYLLRQLVEKQVAAVAQGSTAKSVRKTAGSVMLDHAGETRNQLRQIHAHLAGRPGHLYARDPETGKTVVAPHLDPAHIENLVRLELGNGKLDLASRWLAAVDPAHMSRLLWTLYFQVHAAAQPALWVAPALALYEHQVLRRQSALVSEQPWKVVLDSFVQKQRLASGSSGFVFDRALLRALLAAMAYQGDTRQVQQLVESSFGVRPDGSLCLGQFPLRPNDPKFPGLDLVEVLVSGCLFNRDPATAMAYLNAFQTHYGADLGTHHARRLWNAVFKWGDVRTRFSAHRAFAHYLHETKTVVPMVSRAAADYPQALADAQALPQFDYEGYLAFLAALQRRRSGLLDELWRCYHAAGSPFSPTPYRRYLALLKELPDENRGFEYLRQLARQISAHATAQDSYNAPAARSRVLAMRHLYTQGMECLVNAKGEAGLVMQVAPLIRKWGLDDEMRAALTRWAHAREDRYMAIRTDLELRQQAEDDEGFLDLM